jgi:hypothetical protein
MADYAMSGFSPDEFETGAGETIHVRGQPISLAVTPCMKRRPTRLRTCCCLSFWRTQAR